MREKVGFRLHASRVDRPERHRRRVIGAVVTALALLLVAGGTLGFFSGDAPAAVDITSAVGQAGTSSDEPDSAGTDGSASDGTWVVDTSVGEFSITDSTGTFVGVRVDEELANVGATTAVIRTPEVDGTIELDALPTADDPVNATATGELTINGVTNTVDVPLQIAMTDGVAVVTGTFDVTLADYGVQAPSAPIVLSVADTGAVELQLFLTPA